MNKKIKIILISAVVLVIGGSLVWLAAEKKSFIPSSGQPDIKIGASSVFGQYLVDVAGRTLYLSTKDSPDSSMCENECLRMWPVFFAGETAIVADGLSEADFGIMKRPNGSLQTTFKKYPLYYYSNDTKIGDTLGHGVNIVWSVVDPKNDPATLGIIEKPVLERSPSATEPLLEPAKTIYTIIDVAPHGTPRDCWMIIDGKVYDASPTIKKGEYMWGPLIIEGCGKDATALFKRPPMGDGTVSFESSRTWLAASYIGDLR